ncbi:hypothetical protein BVI2075_50024 [Burkholderia vietnamiensis]|nr:hypothetical protein BVI2075_50024 [Burkholderia vietnamiensis]
MLPVNMPNSAIPIAIARSMAPPRSVMTRQHHRFRCIIPTVDGVKKSRFPEKGFPRPRRCPIMERARASPHPFIPTCHADLPAARHP